MLELGPADGAPVFYLHGLAGSPLRPCHGLDDAGVRLLVAPRRARTLTAAAAEILAHADALGIERFAVLGVSAGGPVALACARRLPPARLAATGVVGGTVPLVGRDAPPRLTRVERALVAAATLRRTSTALGAPAAWALHRRGACAGTARAMLADGRMAIGPRFAPESVRGEVLIWHGARDRLVPLEHALAHARRVPGAHVTVLLGEGHFFLREHLGAVLAPLAGAVGARYVALPAA